MAFCCPFVPSLEPIVSTVQTRSIPNTSSTMLLIRMGGGRRTYPGGVSRWRWKRMQLKKNKELEIARLAREREIYNMRKKAEFKAATSEPEKPWETVEKYPTLFSAGADEQLKALASRFQKPSGFDMWVEEDGPQLFTSPTPIQGSLFFPKGAIPIIYPKVVFPHSHSSHSQTRFNLMLKNYAPDLSPSHNTATDPEKVAENDLEC